MSMTRSEVSLEKGELSKVGIGRHGSFTARQVPSGDADSGASRPPGISKQSLPGGNTFWKSKLYANRTEISALVAATCGTTIGYPFDSLKTRMQTFHYASIWKCATTTIRDEGWKGLYRGVLPPLFTSSVTKSISFSMFDRGRTWLWDHDIPGKAGLMKENTSRNQAERTLQAISGVAFIAGGFSGTVMALAICPLEQVKIQMQLSRLIGNERLVKGQAPSSKGLTNMQAFREIVRLRGVYGLYSGLRLHVARDSFGTAVYFGAYDTIKETLRRANSDGKSNTLSHLLAGGTCGVLSWLVVFPIDLIKSTIQKDVLQPKEVTTSSSHCSSQRPGRVSGMGLAKSIYQRYGISGLYRGVGVTLIRAFPLHGLNFVVYEFVRQTITDFSKEDANA